MSVTEETIDGTLYPGGQVQLSHLPHLPPGPVSVTLRPPTTGVRHGLADVIREIAAEQRSRGFAGRSAEELRAEEEASLAEDSSRDRELDLARCNASSGAP